MADVELFGARQSTYLRVAWMTCEEKGAPYAIRPAMPQSPEILAMHPFGRIPAMRHGRVTLFESKAIATYIDRVFPGPPLIPDDPVGQARVEQWISAVNTSIEPVWTLYFRAHVFPKGRDGGPDWAAVAAPLPAMAQHLLVLDRVLASSAFLAGDAFSLADIAVLPILHYLHQFPEGAEMAAGQPHLTAYFGKLCTRPSARATVPPPMSEIA
jgi:glutathione S-transferase